MRGIEYNRDFGATFFQDPNQDSEAAGRGPAPKDFWQRREETLQKSPLLRFFADPDVARYPIARITVMNETKIRVEEDLDGKFGESWHKALAESFDPVNSTLVD